MRAILFIAASIIFLLCKGQQIYLPYNIQEAYNNNSRNINGKPGEKYFQNKAKYIIKAEFNPKNGVLIGSERIVYYNNSPDSLYYFVIRLYHDILKKGNVRDEEIPAEYLTDGMEINEFKINNKDSKSSSIYYFNRQGTNLFVGLNYFILPGDSVVFDIDWKTTIPTGHVHRFGKYGKGNWFIGYWYPQLAVYDDIDGWNKHNYTGTYEFYNDINNFNIEISLPAGYLAWATGNWLNAKEILSPQVFERLQEAKESDNSTMIVRKNDWREKIVLANNKKLTYRYSINEVPDFAFAVSNNYEWNASSTVIDSTLESRTLINAVFPPEAEDFKQIAEIGAAAVNHFSHNSLQVPYPYNNVTIFCGDGGMEFPMMVNMRNTTYSKNVFTAMHELFHAYFPFYTGTNEQKYAWLDEGLTSYLPIDTEAAINKTTIFALHEFIDLYNDFSGEDQESPLFTPSVQTRSYNYYHQAYYRSTVAFAMLEQYLGREIFRAAIIQFIHIWKYKHPTGYDFIFTLNNFVEEDLMWLIEPWFFGNAWADLSLEKVTKTNNGFDISIINQGGMPVPVHLKIIPIEGESYFIQQKADVWKDTSSITIHISNQENLKRIELGELNVPDKVRENNVIELP